MFLKETAQQFFNTNFVRCEIDNPEEFWALLRAHKVTNTSLVTPEFILNARKVYVMGDSVLVDCEERGPFGRRCSAYVVLMKGKHAYRSKRSWYDGGLSVFAVTCLRAIKRIDQKQKGEISNVS